MLSVVNLSKNYGGFRAVQDVSLEVGKGELVTLLGPSGCGKSTTLRCIAGLEHATSGEIRIANTTLSAPNRGIELPPEKRNLGMVFQSYALWPHLTVHANVAYPLKARKLDRQTVERRSRETLEMVGLADQASKKPGELSGGQQQRVALARALASECNVLLFDEPLSNLDVRLRESMRTQIRELQLRLGITSIYVTHDQSEALAVSDRIAVMDKGRIVQIGKPREIYERPKTEFVATFLGSVNLVSVTVDGDVQDGFFRYRLPDGSSVLTQAAADGSGARDGLMGLRAELIQLAGSQHGGLNEWPAEILHATFLGDTSEYVMKTFGGVEIKALVPPYQRFSKGQKVFLSVMPEDTFVVSS